jgi:Transcriptional regulatory protein, C terminal
VLAILLLHANRMVSLDRLVDELWDETPPARSIGSSQAYICHLRHLLEPDRAARAPARVLVVGKEKLDASRLEALTAEGHRLLRNPAYERAAAVHPDPGHAAGAQPARTQSCELIPVDKHGKPLNNQDHRQATGPAHQRVAELASGPLIPIWARRRTAAAPVVEG